MSLLDQSPLHAVHGHPFCVPKLEYVVKRLCVDSAHECEQWTSPLTRGPYGWIMERSSRHGYEASEGVARLWGCEFWTTAL
jgi:hypothetical protein